MKQLVIALLLMLVACDKDAAPTAGTDSGTSGAPTETVDDLVAKLPEGQKPPSAPIEVQFFGKFGLNGSLPGPDGEQPFEVDPKAVAELNVVSQFRIESAFAERAVNPNESIIVQRGGEESDGLLLTVRYQGKSASRKIVPASNGPELVSNLDHTVDRVLDELGVPRKPR